MSFPDFNSLSAELTQMFQNARYAEALELATREANSFPDDRAWVEYWRMAAAARLENRPLMYSIADQLLADGIWFGEMIWRETTSFRPLQGDAEFERRVADSLAIGEREVTVPGAQLLTRLPENHSAASPLLVALHGNQHSASGTLPFWEPAVGQGWALALPQSDQAVHTAAYVWNNLERAEARVRQSFAELPQQLAYDAGRVVLAGHSMGGLVTIKMALEAAVNVCGFVTNGAVVPFAGAPDALDALLEPARQRGLRGYFIAGADDASISHDDLRVLSGKLDAAGIPCQLEFVPGARHPYHPGFDAALLRGLEFVAG